VDGMSGDSHSNHSLDEIIEEKGEEAIKKTEPMEPKK
jgi:hypothetical protein